MSAFFADMKNVCKQKLVKLKGLLFVNNGKNKTRVMNWSERQVLFRF